MKTLALESAMSTVKPAMIPLHVAVKPDRRKAIKAIVAEAASSRRSGKIKVDAIRVRSRSGLKIQGAPLPRPGRQLRRCWRIGFLGWLRKKGQMVKAMDLAGVSRNLVYPEIEAEELFAEAVKMARGLIPWDEDKWLRALEQAHEKERGCPATSRGKPLSGRRAETSSRHHASLLGAV